jgi:hypothetical protein
VVPTLAQTARMGQPQVVVIHGADAQGWASPQRRRTRRSRKTLYAYCTIGLFVCNILITKEIVVEATGVELISMLTARKLLILGSATRAKKAPLPDPLYVYCTKLVFALESNRHHIAARVSHRFSKMDRKSTEPPMIR